MCYPLGRAQEALSAELLQLGKRLELGKIARALGMLGKVVEAAPGIDRHAWLYTRVMAVKTLSVVAHAYDVALARKVPLRRIDVTAAGPPPSFSAAASAAATVGATAAIVGATEALPNFIDRL